MTKDMQEFQAWIAHASSANEKVSAIILEYSGGRVRGDELHRIEPGELGWDTVEDVARVFDDVATKHALSFDHYGQYQLLAVREGQFVGIYPFLRRGRLPPPPMSEGELCARIVDDLEAGKSPVAIVREYRLTLTFVMGIHRQWLAAKRAHAPKPATKPATKRASTKIPNDHGPSAA